MRLIEKVRLAASRPPRRLVGGLRRHLIYANQMAIPGRAARSVYGPRLLKRPGDITFYLCVSGAYGPMIPEIIGAMPAPFVFLDIGANIGLFSLIAASHGHCERVVAIEPIPETIDLLKGNFALNRAADRLDVGSGHGPLHHGFASRRD